MKIPTCETCKFWKRQPDYVGHGVAEGIVIRFGACSKLEIGWWEAASEDMLGTNESHCSEPRDEITTGINFGCIHHSKI